MCPNCGKGQWKEREGWECELCHFRYIASKKGPDCSPVYCEGCGCSYSDGCTLHSASQQKPLFPAAKP